MAKDRLTLNVCGRQVSVLIDLAAVVPASCRTPCSCPRREKTMSRNAVKKHRSTLKPLECVRDD